MQGTSVRVVQHVFKVPTMELQHALAPVVQSYETYAAGRRNLGVNLII